MRVIKLVLNQYMKNKNNESITTPPPPPPHPIPYRDILIHKCKLLPVDLEKGVKQM